MPRSQQKLLSRHLSSHTELSVTELFTLTWRLSYSNLRIAHQIKYVRHAVGDIDTKFYLRAYPRQYLRQPIYRGDRRVLN